MKRKTNEIDVLIHATKRKIYTPGFLTKASGSNRSNLKPVAVCYRLATRVIVIRTYKT